MGSLIDTEKADKNIRCKDVKLAIVLINLIGAPISFLLLSLCIIRVLLYKPMLTFITYIITLIFFSEILNTISKMLQFLKYSFYDTREDNNKNSVETPRGKICQFQIVLSIISDFCSLLGTLLISLRCHDVIKRKKKFFDKKSVQIASFMIIILSSIILSISFLLIDRRVTRDSITFKYDLRDRCNYWCWLEHKISIVCYVLYTILVILNLIYALKTNGFLKREYEKIWNQSIVLIPKSNSININEKEKDNNQSKLYEDLLSSENKKRIKELQLLQIKVKIYPWATITIWLILLSYRMLDDISMSGIDSLDKKGGNEEIDYLNDYPALRILLEIFLVLHTLLSSIRGIIYSLIFIIFEEKIFWNCFQKFIICYSCCCCCCKFNNFDELESGGNEGIIRNTDNPLTEENTSLTETSKNEDFINGRKSNISDLGRNSDTNSDYHYND